MTTPVILSVKAAAKVLNLHKSVLDRWRLQEIGPRWIRLGPKKIGYDLKDLLQWIDDNKRGDPGPKRGS